MCSAAACLDGKLLSHANLRSKDVSGALGEGLSRACDTRQALSGCVATASLPSAVIIQGQLSDARAKVCGCTQSCQPVRPLPRRKYV